MSNSFPLRQGLAAAATIMLAVSSAKHACATEVSPTGPAAPKSSMCGSAGHPALQVLGSSGPLNAGGRASTSYLVWLMGRAAIMVDTGPGSTASLARAGASPSDLDAILLTHLHPDHVSDLAALLWDEDVLGRHRALFVAGPAANEFFPDTRVFLERLFGTAGAFPELQTVMKAGSAFHLDVKVIETAPIEARQVISIDGAHIFTYP